MKNSLLLLLIYIISYKSLVASNFALPQFYKNNPYSYLVTPKKKKVLPNECDSYTKPIFGVKTHKDYVYSPTKAATDGLISIFEDKKEKAIHCSEILLKNSTSIKDALFFPFEFDFIPYMPINLRKGWVSGITQGLSLGLFTHLYVKTGEKKYLKIAKKIFESYRIPIEKGGFVRLYSDSALFEEYPTKELNGVFNGSAIAAIALWDYYLVTKDEEAKGLFFKYVKWIEDNISRYEKLDEKTGVLLSYYSLVIKRPEILFRFFGEGLALIENISSFCLRNNETINQFSLKLGTKRDDDSEEPIYIFSAKEYTNWSKRLKNGRIINQNIGEYNHSPFYTYLDPSCDEIEIEIKFKRLSEKSIQLQVYDGKEYHLVGELKGELNKSNVNKFHIKKELVDNVKTNLPKNPIVEHKYLDDNYLLLKIIAETSNSEILLKHAKMWRESTYFVPSEFYNNPPVDILKESEIIFDTKKSCKYGINGISLIKQDKFYYLLYNCQIEERESRLSLLFGTNIKMLKEAGYIFNSELINNHRINKTKFGYLLNDFTEENRPFLSLFFISDSELFQVITNNIWQWENMRKISKLNAESLVVIPNPNNDYKIIYVDSEERNKIKIKTLKSEPVSIIIEKAYLKFTDIAYGKVAGKEVLIVRKDLPNRSDIDLYVDCENGKFSGDKVNPIIIEKDYIEKSDSIKENLFFYSENDEYYLLFSGRFPKHNIPNGLYISKIKGNVLSNLIQNECQKKDSTLLERF
ncbi:MAG: D-glucuronyl C5-epimerase family protein [Deltaproteobacteria bacterium]|nr:D-glucuronyl C5-epimerase family protein [Deltaproteobacteria bacterium]